MADKKKFDPTVRYVPEYQLRAIGGAKSPKAHPRPFVFAVRSYWIKTQNDGDKINTYLLFGGIPTEKLHNKLDEVGFKVRRRSRTWENKKTNEVVDVADRDNECYAVYYTMEPLTKEQASLIAKLFMVTAGIAQTGKGFLAPNWATVEKTWGDKEDWLTVCCVQPEEDEQAAAEDTVVSDDAIDIDALDDLI